MSRLPVVFEGETWRWPRTGVGRFAFRLGAHLTEAADAQGLALSVWAGGRLWPAEVALQRFAAPRWSDRVTAVVRAAARRAGGGALRRLWRQWQAQRWAAVRGAAAGRAAERLGSGCSGAAGDGGAAGGGAFGGADGVWDGLLEAAGKRVWFAPNFVPSVWERRARLVVTVHDLSCFDHPEWHPAERVRFMQTHLPRAVAEAAAVTVVSEATRTRLMTFFSVPPQRVVVTYPGVDPVFRPVGFDDAQRWLRRWRVASGRYFLCVGTLEPRKNWETVLRAYAELPASVRQQVPLLVVGLKGWLTEALERVAAPLVAEGCVRFLGFVPDGALAALYSHTAGFFYLSFYEGFGLPPLEAMACGAPVVVSNVTSLPEVVGEAGVQLAPTDCEGVRDVMVRLAEDAAWRAALSQKGLVRAQRFTWEACARETAAALRLAAEV